MFGNGFNYAVMSSINWDLDKDENYLINPIKVQPEVIEFLQSIPTGRAGHVPTFSSRFVNGSNR